MRRSSRLTAIAAIASFALGGLTLIASLFGLTLSRRPEITHEALPAGGQAPAKTA